MKCIAVRLVGNTHSAFFLPFKKNYIMPTQILLLVLAVVHIIWGGGFIVLKLAQQYFTLEQVLLGRVLFASVLYLLMWKWIPKPEYKKGDWKLLLLVLLCEPFLLFTFETLGLEYTSASQGGMIVACAPLTVAMGAFFVYKERVSSRCVAGILFAVLGVIIVCLAGSAGEHGSNPLLGNMFIFCAVLSSTCYALVVKHLAARYHYLFLSAIQVFGATVLFIPFAAQSPLPESVSMEAIASLVYLAVGITFCVYLTINYALTQVKAAQVILFTNLIPISTLVLAYFVLDETLTTYQYAGAFLVIIGVGLASKLETASA